MPRNQGITFERWAICARCGFSFPETQLTPQKGLLLCPKDLDNLDVEMRPRMIAEVLQDEETQKDRPNVADDSGDLVF